MASKRQIADVARIVTKWVGFPSYEISSEPDTRTIIIHPRFECKFAAIQMILHIEEYLETNNIKYNKMFVSAEYPIVYVLFRTFQIT